MLQLCRGFWIDQFTWDKMCQHTVLHKHWASSRLPYEINKTWYVHGTDLGVEILALIIKISTIFNQKSLNAP